MKFYILLILFLFIVSPAIGQFKKNNLTSKPAVIQVESTIKNSKEKLQRIYKKVQDNNSLLNVELTKRKGFAFIATVVYPSGEVKPIANSTFYILDTDFLTILKSAGIEPTDATLQNFEGDADKALISDAGYSLSGKYSSPYRELAEKVTIAIKPYIVQQTITDASGKGFFKGLDQSNYYLLGTGGAYYSNVIWNMKIDTTKDSQLVLDQRNAAKVH
jgi:hypothetical protein